jgi:HPt (histidine-containing phosphotransfer) domain-containing protein
MDDYLKHLESIIGTDSLKNLLLDFEHCSLITLDNLSQSIESLNKNKIIEYAHEMKGMCLTIGAEKLAELSLEIEDIARTSTKHELSQNNYIYTVFSDLTDEIENINDFIKQIIK